MYWEDIIILLGIIGGRLCTIRVGGNKLIEEQSKIIFHIGMGGVITRVSSTIKERRGGVKINLKHYFKKNCNGVLCIALPHT